MQGLMLISSQSNLRLQFTSCLVFGVWRFAICSGVSLSVTSVLWAPFEASMHSDIDQYGFVIPWCRNSHYLSTGYFVPNPL
jgi:hypothetical protein